MARVLISKTSITGEVRAFAGSAAPEGWLICDGNTISRTIYPELFAAIGTLHGEGDGTTTFHLPDYRGRFLRGADDMGTVRGPAGRDPGGRTTATTGVAAGVTVGSVQDSDNKSHTHTTILGQQSTTTATERLAYSANTTLTSSGGGVNPTGGMESRPKNANVNYIIKY
jgi:microcystin-dependent protein